WDARTGALKRMLAGHRGLIMSLAFSADGQRLVSGAFDETPKCWDAHTGALLKRFSDPSVEGGFVYGVALSRDGQHLATASYLGEVTLWDATTGALRRRLGSNAYVGSVACSADGRLIATGTWANLGVRVWDAQTGASVWTPGGRFALLDGSTMLAFTRDGTLLASAQFD